MKLVLFYNNMVFGYTGIARIADEQFNWLDTGKWLVRVLQNEENRDPLVAVKLIKQAADAASARMRKIGVAARLAFLGVGWRPQLNTLGLAESCVCRISNFHSPNGHPKTTADEDFSISTETIRPDEMMVAHIGAAITTETARFLRESVSQLDCEAALGVKHLELFKDVIRRTADHYRGRYVGKDVLAAAIPRAAATSSQVGVYSPQSGQGLYYSEPSPTPAPPVISELSVFLRFRDGRDVGEYEAPHIVAPSLPSFVMFMLGTKFDGQSSFQATFRKNKNGYSASNVRAERDRRRRRKR